MIRTSVLQAVAVASMTIQDQIGVRWMGMADRKNAIIELLSVRIEFSFLKIGLISNILICLESLGHLETDATSFARFRLS